MRHLSVHRSSSSRYMSRSTYGRSSVGRRNSYGVKSSAYSSYLEEAQKTAEDIKTKKTADDTVTANDTRTKASSYKVKGSRFNTGTSGMKTAAEEINEQLGKQEPDTEKMYNAAVRYAECYNDMKASVRNSASSAVKSKSDYISDVEGIFSRALGNIGITADKNGDLSVDRDKFMSADKKDISGIFGTRSSFASLIAEQTDSISTLSLLSADTYSGFGGSSYTSAMSGSLLSKLF